MAIQDLNQRYTIEKYFSKQEVSRALGTNLIEPFWREISEFRRKFAIELPIFDASFIKYYLTYIDSVQGKTAQANDRVSSFVSSISKISNGSISEFTFVRDMLFGELKSIAKINNLDVSDITLSNIIQRIPVEPQYKILERYFESLQALRKDVFDNIDDSFLAKYYAILRGEEELTCFYREDDVETVASKSLIDKEYDQGIPSHLIDEVMAALLDYVNNFDISLVTRLSAIFFMFNYVKPFDLYNMELATLLAKRVLASTSIDSSCVFVPLESFLNDQSFFGEVSREVKRTHDFTYAFLRGAELINDSFDVAISKLSEVHITSIDKEVISDEHPIRSEVTPKPSAEIKKPAQKVLTKNQIQRNIESKTAVETIKLSEKELKAKMYDLLEQDPFLKKNQAYFYVRHCTPGRYYSIQQFVKEIGCVYETGRTSMDNLAKLGYYRREQIKNKFVYTPINKE